MTGKVGLIYSFLIAIVWLNTSSTMALAKLIALEFEVFGKVQGVFFRKFTVTKGRELGLRGWCRNTDHGTVQGEIEGFSEKVSIMKDWLCTTGSPKSKIIKTEFRNEREITEYTMSTFEVRKT